MKRKQVVTLVSIAVISFLIGITFSVMTMATDGGNPFEKIWEAIYDVESREDSLNASYLDLLDRVEALEGQPLPQGFVSVPAYDSGWIEISPSETVTLTHNLNTTEVFVYMIGRCGVLIHQYKYGSDGNDVGAYWYDLTEDEIRIYRASNDWQIKNWSGVRVMIWKIEEPTS